jgi:hypothetical protein
MSDTAKKQYETQAPVNYSPKKPKILTIAETAVKSNLIKHPVQNKCIIKDVPPLNAPWVGCCEFIKSFASFLLKIDSDKFCQKSPVCLGKRNFMGECKKCGKCESDTVIAHRDRIYKSYLPIAGNGLSNSFDPNNLINRKKYVNYISGGNSNQSYYILDGYIKNAFTYAGYSYKRYDNTGDNKSEIFKAIVENIDNDIPVIGFFPRSAFLWQVITGYDSENDLIYWCRGNKPGSVKCEEWYENLSFILPTTGKTTKKLTLSDILYNDIMILQQTDFNGISAGSAAYEACIEFLSDDAYFDTTSENKLICNYQQLHNYIGYHAEARAFSGEGFRLLSINENTNEKVKQLLLKCGDLGWEHHDIAWDGWNVMKPWPCQPEVNAKLQREIDVRNTIINSVKRMAKNDKQLIAVLSECLANYNEKE